MKKTEHEQIDIDLKKCEKWPYQKHEYLLRIIWNAVWHTIWKLCWHRFPQLRATILRFFGARVAGGVRIESSSWIQRPWDLTIGRACAIGPRSNLYNLGPLTIGNNTIISQGVHIVGGTHDYTDITYPLLRKKIQVEDNVWIAADAFIGPGVKIGKGAVVGARSVVINDVEAWTVVAGNPARVIRRREVKVPNVKA